MSAFAPPVRRLRETGPVEDRVRAGMVIVEDGHLAVIERHRQDRHYFTVPGGGVEQDESIEEAAVREALEELGVDVKLLGSVATVTVAFRGGAWVTRQHYFAAHVVGGVFGSGGGPEVPARPRPLLGSYHPTWLALGETVELVVHPQELVAELRARGLESLLDAPVELAEVVEG